MIKRPWQFHINLEGVGLQTIWQALMYTIQCYTYRWCAFRVVGFCILIIFSGSSRRWVGCGWRVCTSSFIFFYFLYFCTPSVRIYRTTPSVLTRFHSPGGGRPGHAKGQSSLYVPLTCTTPHRPLTISTPPPTHTRTHARAPAPPSIRYGRENNSIPQVCARLV